MVLTFVIAAAIGLASSMSAPAPASASTAAGLTDVHTPRPAPFLTSIHPLSVGLHVIDAIAAGIANAVELIATPAPIAIPAPDAAEGS
ncbi:MAG TPA: hypothetical protein VHI10_07625 [Mycobacterium sp.]|nr:hypothetical protein [Mycobacterium sp.]